MDQVAGELGGPAVRVAGFSWTYEGASASTLSGIDLAIDRGSCVVLTGPSGCGKSTLTYALNGLIPHVHEGLFAGTVEVAGVPVLASASYEVARHVGSVFQDPRSQFFTTTTTDEAAFGCENLGLPADEIAQRVDEAFAAIGADDLRDREIFGLSSGQKQKVAIASVLAMRPDVVVMDEPSANLDNASCGMLADVLAALKRAGKTVVVAEHRLHYLAGVADRVVVMEAGRITGELTPQEASELAYDEAVRRGLRLADLARVPLRGGRDAPGKGGAPAVEVRGLAVSYGGHPVLESVSFAADAAEPEVIAIIGHNGAGKTTLMRALCGLKREASGSVLVGGVPQPPAARRERAVFVMQDADYQLFTESVEAELHFARPDSPDLERRIDRALADLGLGGLRTVHPMTLSGGQKQRLTIACALTSDARIVFFDEPTSGLDGGNMREVARLVRLLADEGRRVFVVTHDFEFVAEAADRVLFVDQGRIADDFPVAECNRAKLLRYLGLAADPPAPAACPPAVGG